jgi:hypothetical protein
MQAFAAQPGASGAATGQPQLIQFGNAAGGQPIQFQTLDGKMITGTSGAFFAPMAAATTTTATTVTGQQPKVFLEIYEKKGLFYDEKGSI